MKYSDAMLKGYALAGERKAIGTRMDETGAVCALGAAAMGYLAPSQRTVVNVRWNWPHSEEAAREAFREAYGIEIAWASNGDYDDAHDAGDKPGVPGLPIDVIAGMLRAIGY